MFIELRRVLETALGTIAVSIEHVGSTAVPGLAAKPIIDLDVVIASPARLPDAIQALGLLGYVHEGDFGISGREALSRQDNEVPRDGTGRTWPKHHLYTCARGSAELVKHVAFRDYPRDQPEAAAAYAQLKGQLAQQFPHDREAYTQGKNAFVEAILRQAMG
jgi:GrpB-like predicted nucleotidyltransferase (UPF0157 family)